MTKGAVIAVSVISGVTLGLGVWWWFKHGRLIYFTPQMKVKTVDKEAKTLGIEFGGETTVYKHKKGMAMHIPGRRGFDLIIRESAPYAEFPKNLNFIIKKGDKVIETPSPFGQ
ncbi:MAG: hypothetical protein COA79_20310 [Planctomycetota bacterium]|nr:MAG: hypothetical protein COA79_20310 [Planctomycetota bacterium]